MRRFSIVLIAVGAMSLSVTGGALPKRKKASAKQVTKIGYLSCHVTSDWECDGQPTY